MIQEYLKVLVLAGIGLGFMYLLKKVNDYLTPFNDDAEVEFGNNLAVSFRRVGWYLALVLGLSGAISSANGVTGFVEAIALDGMVILVALFVTSFLCDRVILRNVDNTDEIGKKNYAVGIVEIGSLTAIGLILNGSFAGEGGGILSAVIFTALGLAALLLLSVAYELLTKADIGKEIGKGNVAAGLSLAGQLVALGIILRASIIGPFLGWYKDLASFGSSFILALVLLWAIRFLADVFFLPSITNENAIMKKNVAAIALVEGVAISVAILVSKVI